MAEDAKKTQMRKKKILKITQIFFIIIIILTFTSKSIRNLTLPKVSVINVKPGSLTVEIVRDGTVKAVERVEHYIDFSATVKEVNVSVGDVVAVGEPILTLDKEALEIELVKREIDLKKLKLQYDKAMIGNIEDSLYTYEQRLKETEMELLKIEEEVIINENLYSLGAISKKELDDMISKRDLAKLRLENADKDLTKQEEMIERENEGQKKEMELMKLDISSIELEIKELKKRINSCTVTATMDGVIKELSFKEGMIVNNSRPVYILDSPNKGFEAEVILNSHESQYLEIDDNVKIFLKSQNDSAINGVIKSIKDDENKDRNLVVVGIEDTNLKGGEICEFYLKKPIGSYSALVPRQALREDEKGRFVYILEEKEGPLGKEYRVVRNDVTEGDSDRSSVGIYSGLIGDERVIVRSSKTIYEGSLVTIE